MGEDIKRPVPYLESPEYITFGLAAGYAQNFRTGASGAYVKGERWAKYWWKPYLVVLVTELQEGIFSVVSYPPAGFEVAMASEIEEWERFRGWILEYVPDPYGWHILAASQEVGIDEFIKLRREYKQG